MSYRGLILGFVVLSINSVAFSQAKDSGYRETYLCEEGGPIATCIVGTVPKGADVTLLTQDGAVSAKPIRELPNQDFPSGRVTGTLLQASKKLPAGDHMLAVLVPVSAISMIAPKPGNDPVLVQKLEAFIVTMNREFTVRKERDHRWLNPHVTIRIVGLARGLSIAEATIRYDRELYVPARQAIEADCKQCDEETITLLVHDDGIFELFNRKGTILCSKFVAAFQMHGRIYAFTTANGCENGLLINQVQDVSGPTPQTVFSSSFFSN